MSRVIFSHSQTDEELFQSYYTYRQLETRQEIVKRYSFLIDKISSRYTNTLLEDAKQIALVGLLSAIERYDPKKGDFKPFAAATIKGEIKHHLRDKTWAVHVPRRTQELVLNLNQTRDNLRINKSHDPTDEELEEKLHISSNKLNEVKQAEQAHSASSLNIIIGDPISSSELVEHIPNPGPEEDFKNIENHIFLEKLFSKLSLQEKKLLYLFYFQDKNQSQVAKELKCSQVHVSRLLRKTLAKLRKLAEKQSI